ncbi:probable endochitinase isoform X2 [Anabrus simplex]|uniref:probable endochitinase isoform X2 n=1 Tax=Anabrus simplex TaxID=316456 RepID=UPI0034DCCBB5
MKNSISTLLILFISSLPVTYGQKCNENGFYCVSGTEVQLCIDDGPPVGDIWQCPTPTVCSMGCWLECTDPADICTVPTTTTTTPMTTTPTTTTPTTTTTSITTPTTETPFQCSAAGRFPDARNCSNYWICSISSTGGYIQYLYTCPSGSLFDSSINKCSLGSVVCAGSTTTSITVSGESTPSAGFECTASGRFPDPLSNKYYYICSPSSSGDYIMNHYTCPSTSIFDATSKKCVLP